MPLFWEMGVAVMVGPDSVRISVALVAFNGARFLREQLSSILMQLGETDEVVVSDDGSTDGTLAILEEYRAHDPRIRLLQGPGRGVKKNVEHALSHCRGEYIFLADQDDIWLPGKVQKVCGIFEEKQAGLVIHDASVFVEGAEKADPASFFAFRGSRAGVRKNMMKNSYIGCCMAFRARLLTRALPIPDRIEMHDQWIGVLNDFYYKDSYFCQEPLILYRRHGDNASAMTRYGIGKMIRNRVVFLWYFLRRIL